MKNYEKTFIPPAMMSFFYFYDVPVTYNSAVTTDLYLVHPVRKTPY